jgi:hypothetical protein
VQATLGGPCPGVTCSEHGAPPSSVLPERYDGGPRGSNHSSEAVVEPDLEPTIGAGIA